MKINCTYTELVEPHKLVSHPKNPSKHSDDQIEKLAKIINFKGQRSPVVVSQTEKIFVNQKSHKLLIPTRGKNGQTT